MFRNYKYNILVDVDLHLASEQMQQKYTGNCKKYPQISVFYIIRRDFNWLCANISGWILL